MRVFVSGSIRDQAYVQRVQKKLREAGHTITHDWTKNETGSGMLSSPEDKLRDVAETSRRAKDDIQGVVDCDAYIICTDNKTAAKACTPSLAPLLPYT